MTRAEGRRIRQPLSRQEIDDALELAEVWSDGGTEEDVMDGEEVTFEVRLRRNLLHPRLVILTHRPDACPRCATAAEWTRLGGRPAVSASGTRPLQRLTSS